MHRATGATALVAPDGIANPSAGRRGGGMFDPKSRLRVRAVGNAGEAERVADVANTLRRRVRGDLPCWELRTNL